MKFFIIFFTVVVLASVIQAKSETGETDSDYEPLKSNDNQKRKSKLKFEVKGLKTLVIDLIAHMIEDQVRISLLEDKLDEHSEKLSDCIEDSNELLELKTTPRRGTWGYAREECTNLGGQIAQKTLRRNASGKNYHKQIAEVLKSQGDYNDCHFWVGLSDGETEGEWKLVDLQPNKTVDFSRLNYQWQEGYPNNRSPAGESLANCAAIFFPNEEDGQHTLKDFDCEKTVEPHWPGFYGLCEVPIL